ncbi:hypothetical protein [Alkalithermobacter paradoxus]|uniref:Uncharacterized protein n=1 Tax=Alkalithermobacter paradoxus TaxID=29349 RepID=A0A1V4I6K0_9FIRM|nr:hypothetical protein CLOTH_13420 [[Clostridium] thermoalcaliphilum]
MIKVSSASTTRIQSMYVNKSISPNSISKIKQVSKANKVNNNLNGYNPNFMLWTDYFYNNLKHGNSNLHNQNSNIQPSSNDNLLEIFQKLIQNFNTFIYYLKKLDSKNHYTKEINNILNENKASLSLIGISLNKYGYISLNEGMFCLVNSTNKEYILSFLNPEDGLVISIYKKCKCIIDEISKEYSFKEGILFDKKY